MNTLNFILVTVLVIVLVYFINKVSNLKKEISNNDDLFKQTLIQTNKELQDCKTLSEKRRVCLNEEVDKTTKVIADDRAIENNYRILRNQFNFTLYLLELIDKSPLQFIHFDGFDAKTLRLKQNEDKLGYKVFGTFAKEELSSQGKLSIETKDSGLVEYKELNNIIRLLKRNDLIPPTDEAILRLTSNLK